jgi:hypothetical protein
MWRFRRLLNMITKRNAPEVSLNLTCVSKMIQLDIKNETILYNRI